jgi:hypothetical protein
VDACATVACSTGNAVAIAAAHSIQSAATTSGVSNSANDAVNSAPATRENIMERARPSQITSL